MQLTADQREVIRRIVRRHGGAEPRVFGSFARGDATVSSDLDLLVALEPDRSLLDLVAIKLDLGEELGLSVDVLTPRSISPYLRDRILDEAVPA